MSRKLCVIAGDGVGREVTSSAVEVLECVSSDVAVTFADAGWQTFCDQGHSVPGKTFDRIRDSGAALFGAVSSPSKKVRGYQSAILNIRQTLELYGNIRPVRGLWNQPPDNGIDLVIVRENSEGLYAGRESREEDRAVAEKVVTRKASLRIGRMAAMVANTRQMQSVMIAHKANVLPVSEGLFRDSVRESIEEQSPEIDIREGLVDIVAHHLVARPESFEVLVTTNMFGDILSDLAAHWCGGMGRAPGLNLGDDYAVAEPVHGSAPDIAGKGIADPSATILSLALMFRFHWNDEQIADQLEQATIQAIGEWEEGQPMNTRRFTDRVMSHVKAAAMR